MSNVEAASLGRIRIYISINVFSICLLIFGVILRHVEFFTVFILSRDLLFQGLGTEYINFSLFPFRSTFLSHNSNFNCTPSFVKCQECQIIFNFLWYNWTKIPSLPAPLGKNNHKSVIWCSNFSLIFIINTCPYII